MNRLFMVVASYHESDNSFLRSSYSARSISPRAKRCLRVSSGVSLTFESDCHPRPNARSFIQEHRSNEAAARLRAMVHTTASVRRSPGQSDDPFSEIPMDCLVPGDVVRLSAGDMIPADLRIPLLPPEANSPAPLLPVALRCPHGWRRNGSARLLIGVGIVAAGEGGHGRTIFGNRHNLMCPYCTPAFLGHTPRESGR
jgi:hypothetical protein